MASFDFLLSAKYCNTKQCPFVGNTIAEPNEETVQWFADQNIKVVTGYSSLIGVLCTAVQVSEDQALLIQLAFDVRSQLCELYDNTLD